MRAFAAVLLILLTMTRAADTRANPYYDPAKPHTTPDGFRNNYPHERPGNFWKWRWEKFWAGLPKEPEGGYHPEVLKPNLAWLRTNRGATSLTWIGHVTFLYQVGGLNVLTDPQFSERASPFGFFGPTRRLPPAIALWELPHIDVVVISHNHYDHLDRASVIGLNAQPGGAPLFLVPLGLKAWLAAEGITHAEELDWWQQRAVGGVTLVLLPVQHWSARTPFDFNQTLWGGWLVDHPDFRFFFAGDTGYSADFRDIAAMFPGIDLAAIPIGSYEPRWFMKPVHADPDDAVRIHRDLQARQSVGMHWGTFDLTDETIDEPPQRLAEALARADVSPQRFFVMKFGETRRWAPRTQR